MELEILKQDKEAIEVQLDNLTLVEILRVYLNKDSDVKFAAWKREHPTKKPILSVKAKNPKKAIKDAVSAITKDLDKIEKDFSKLK
ncbi:MAG TPA: RpoL/Rpb11 RNA polymerase subunit family protein [Candidatus Nanoarchaeia archaeon]|nr:RpoL/Rpb11 RNA polymerase subunit family protein [Candidatus Nanoarchaeia archaeon]